MSFNALTEEFFQRAQRFHRAGQLPKAEALYRQILSVNPRHAGALEYLGVLAHQVGRHGLAADLIGQALTLAPANAAGYSNLGAALWGAGRGEEAIAAYRRALELKPDYAEAQGNLALALHGTGRWEEAIAAYRRAVQMKPADPEMHNGQGAALQDAGQLEEAIAAYRRALEIKPAYAEAHNNLGTALQAAGRLDEAMEAYGRALELKPTDADARSNMGVVLQETGRLDEAIAEYRKVIETTPDFERAWKNLAYSVHFHPNYDAAAIAAVHRPWNEKFARPLAGTYRTHSNDRSPERRLRVGFVSPDLRAHPVGRFLTRLFACHDHAGYEFAAYSGVAREDAVTARLREHADLWRDTLTLRDAALAELIHQDRVDILIDLTMHMAADRLLVFARKPAPVQATYLAYCSSTGLTAMDYRLTDPHLDPPGQDEGAYTEKSVYLPESYWCYEPMEACPETGEVPAMHKGYVTFGALNHPAKVSQAALATWCRLLHAVPAARLVMLAAPGSHRARLEKVFAGEGIAPARLTFVERTDWAGYIALHQQLDIMLDPFPYTGGTTTCDALWMGVPTVSLAGRTAVARSGLSILSNVGLRELATHTPEEYIATARNLAEDLPRLATLRRTLRDRMANSPLMDGPRFARHFEAALRDMWRGWCGG